MRPRLHLDSQSSCLHLKGTYNISVHHPSCLGSTFAWQGQRLSLEALCAYCWALRSPGLSWHLLDSVLSASHRTKPRHQSHGDWSRWLENKLWSVVMTTSYHEKEKKKKNLTCVHSELWNSLNRFCLNLECVLPRKKTEPYPEVSVHNIVCQAVSCCSNQGRKILQEWVSFQKAQFCNILSAREKKNPSGVRNLRTVQFD